MKRKTQLYRKYYTESLKKKFNNPDETLLTYFVKEGDLNTCKKLLECGEDVNKPNKDNYTPLIISIKKIDYDMTKLLIKHGADVNITIKYNATPLKAALNIFGSFDDYIITEILNKEKSTTQIKIDKLYLIVNYLLEKNAKTDFYSNFTIKGLGCGTETITPLEYSIRLKDSKLFRILLKYSDVYKITNLFYYITQSYSSAKFLNILYSAKININVLFKNSLNMIINEWNRNQYKFLITNIEEYIKDPELILFTELLNYSKREDSKEDDNSVMERKNKKIKNLLNNIIKPSKDENMSFVLYYAAYFNGQFDIIDELYKKRYNINAKLNYMSSNFLIQYVNSIKNKYPLYFISVDNIITLIKYGIKFLPSNYENLYPLKKRSMKIIAILHSIYSNNDKCIIKQMPLDCVKILYKMLFNIDDIQYWEGQH